MRDLLHFANVSEVRVYASIVHPVYVFDVDRHGMWWSNQANLELWGAKSLADFLSRDFSEDSDTIRRRIQRSWTQAPGVGVQTDSWTIYPEGVPQPVLLHHTAVYIGPDRRRGLLAQIEHVNDGATDNESRWLLAASRYTSTRVSLFQMGGDLICQNQSAWETYGDACTSGAVEFLRRFADPAEGHQRLAAAQSREEVASEHQMNTKLGVRQHLVDIRLTRDPVSGDFALAVTEDDVTELRELIDEAEAANRAKTNFLANMSHELRTPLTGILGFCEVLLDGKVSADQENWLRLIQSSGLGLREILDDLLDLSKISSGNFGLNPKPFSLAALVQGVSHYWLSICTANELDFACQFPEDDIILYGDPVRLRQIFFNLLNNAVKFTEKGTVGLSVRASIEPEDRVRLDCEVWDTGIGILTADRERVFGRFEQVGPDSVGSTMGVGLGLPICREIVSLMNGEIVCESEFGAGTRFRFHAMVSLSQAPSDNVLNLGFEESHLGHDTQLDRVLIADDHGPNRSLLEAFLQVSGAECTLVENGKDAVSALTAGDFDVVLMDSKMPVMTGEEALLQIRSLPGAKARTPVIVLTAHAMDGDRERFLEMGFDGYVGKPVDRRELFAILAAVCGG